MFRFQSRRWLFLVRLRCVWRRICSRLCWDDFCRTSTGRGRWGGYRPACWAHKNSRNAGRISVFHFRDGVSKVIARVVIFNRFFRFIITPAKTACDNNFSPGSLGSFDHIFQIVFEGFDRPLHSPEVIGPQLNDNDIRLLAPTHPAGIAAVRRKACRRQCLY